MFFRGHARPPSPHCPAPAVGLWPWSVTQCAPPQFYDGVYSRSHLLADVADGFHVRPLRPGPPPCNAPLTFPRISSAYHSQHYNDNNLQSGIKYSFLRFCIDHLKLLVCTPFPCFPDILYRLLGATCCDRPPGTCGSSGSTPSWGRRSTTRAPAPNPPPSRRCAACCDTDTHGPRAEGAWWGSQ